MIQTWTLTPCAFSDTEKFTPQDGQGNCVFFRVALQSLMQLLTSPNRRREIHRGRK